MLSFDDQTQAQAQIDRNIAQARALGAAKALAQAMVLFERNENPHEERNAPHPARRRKRIIDPTRFAQTRPSAFGGHVTVDPAVAEHNANTATLGAGEDWERLWHR
jgi:hypothetical protein